MTKSLLGREFLATLCEALGYPVDRVQRIVIDVAIDDAVHIFVQFLGDETLLNLNWPGHLKDGKIEIAKIGKWE